MHEMTETTENPSSEESVPLLSQEPSHPHTLVSANLPPQQILRFFLSQQDDDGWTKIKTDIYILLEGLYDNAELNKSDKIARFMSEICTLISAYQHSGIRCEGLSSLFQIPDERGRGLLVYIARDYPEMLCPFISVLFETGFTTPQILDLLHQNNNKYELADQWEFRFEEFVKALSGEYNLTTMETILVEHSEEAGAFISFLIDKGIIGDSLFTLLNGRADGYSIYCVEKSVFYPLIPTLLTAGKITVQQLLELLILTHYYEKVTQFYSEKKARTHADAKEFIEYKETLYHECIIPFLFEYKINQDELPKSITELDLFGGKTAAFRILRQELEKYEFTQDQLEEITKNRHSAIAYILEFCGKEIDELMDVQNKRDYTFTDSHDSQWLGSFNVGHCDNAKYHIMRNPELYGTYKETSKPSKKRFRKSDRPLFGTTISSTPGLHGDRESFEPSSNSQQYSSTKKTKRKHVKEPNKKDRRGPAKNESGQMLSLHPIGAEEKQPKNKTNTESPKKQKRAKKKGALKARKTSKKTKLYKSGSSSSFFQQSTKSPRSLPENSGTSAASTELSGHEAKQASLPDTPATFSSNPHYCS